MYKNILYKILVIGVILLFVGAGFVSAKFSNNEMIDITDDIGKLNPDIETFQPTDDTYIIGHWPDMIRGDNEYIATQNKYGATPNWGCDILIKFDISEIPKSHRIDSATLYLYYYAWTENNPAGRPLTVYKVIEDWSEDTVTHNTQPVSEEVVSPSANIPDFHGTWMTLDLTEDVKIFHKGEKTNYGWKIMDETYWGTFDIPAAYFYSKESGNENYHPYLEIRTTVSRTKIMYNSFLSELLDRFPNAFPIMRQLLGL
jgi:hypothetical protein